MAERDRNRGGGGDPYRHQPDHRFFGYQDERDRDIQDPHEYGRDYGGWYGRGDGRTDQSRDRGYERDQERRYGDDIGGNPYEGFGRGWERRSGRDRDEGFLEGHGWDRGERQHRGYGREAYSWPEGGSDRWRRDDQGFSRQGRIQDQDHGRSGQDWDRNQGYGRDRDQGYGRDRREQEQYLRNYGPGRGGDERDYRSFGDRPEWARHDRRDDERGGREAWRGRDRGREERGWIGRAADQVASWFGRDEPGDERRHGPARHDEQDRRQRWFGGQDGVASPHRGRGPKGYRRSDQRIEEDVNQRLTDDRQVDASEVQVHVQGGEVTLTGNVDSRAARRRAEDIAEEVGGVTYVMNNLRVRQHGTTGAVG